MNDAYRWARRFVRMLVGFFFRRIEVTGKDALPAEGGGIVVSWHPNGLIDPALIMAHCPKRIVFGARHGLFAWPLFGAFLRALGTVPIYRAGDAGGEAGDEEARRARNRQSLDALAPYFAEHGQLRLDPAARAPANTLVERGPSSWRVRQILLDPEEHREWSLELRVDLAASAEAGAPVLTLVSIGS